jgi:hypothetical protein
LPQALGAVDIGGEGSLNLFRHRQPPLDFGHDALLFGEGGTETGSAATDFVFK